MTKEMETAIKNFIFLFFITCASISPKSIHLKIVQPQNIKVRL